MLNKFEVTTEKWKEAISKRLDRGGRPIVAQVPRVHLADPMDATRCCTKVPKWLRHLVLGRLRFNVPRFACQLTFSRGLSSSPFILAETYDNFICATLDWWPPKKCDNHRCSWVNASILNLVSIAIAIDFL